MDLIALTLLSSSLLSWIQVALQSPGTQTIVIAANVLVTAVNAVLTPFVVSTRHKIGTLNDSIGKLTDELQYLRNRVDSHIDHTGERRV